MDGTLDCEGLGRGAGGYDSVGWEQRCRCAGWGTVSRRAVEYQTARAKLDVTAWVARLVCGEVLDINGVGDDGVVGDGPDGVFRDIDSKSIRVTTGWTADLRNRVIGNTSEYYGEHGHKAGSCGGTSSPVKLSC